MVERDSSGRFIKKDTLTPGLREFMPRLRQAAAIACSFHALRAESAMRSNAPWRDETGNARNGLRARHVPSANADALVLYHTMPYGVWLEVRWSGRYAIIVPTMQTEAIELLTTLSRLLDHMGRGNA